MQRLPRSTAVHHITPFLVSCACFSDIMFSVSKLQIVSFVTDIPIMLSEV